MLAELARYKLFRQAFVLSLRIFQVLLVYGWFQHADVGQIAVALRVVQAIANHKLVGNAKADVIEADGFHALASLVQKRADAQAARLALPQHIRQVVESETAIDNDLHDQHMFLFEGTFQVFEDTYDAT